MMGRREAGQGQFFYSLDLDEVVPLSDTREQPIMVLFSNKDYSPIKDSREPDRESLRRDQVLAEINMAHSRQ